MENPTTLLSSAGQLPQTTSKKLPPPHKRHTKPCKYYQMNRCPYAADVCNFAHILLPPATEKNDTVCRYYAAGNCHNGSQCRYRHLDDGEVPPPYKPEVLHVSIPESRPGWHGMPSPPEKVPIYGPGYPSPYYSPGHHDWSYANGISAQSPVYLPLYNSAPQPGPNAVMPTGPFYPHLSVPPPTAGASPITVSTSRSSIGSTLSTTNFSFDDLRRSEHENGLSTGSSSSLSSESPSTDSDELIIATTEEPKFAEHAHEYQSQVVVTDQRGPVHVPPPQVFYPVPAPGAYHGPPSSQQVGYQHQPHPQNQYYRTGTPSRYGAATPARSTREAPSNPVSRTASRNSQRIKPSKYKTKPCKFFGVDGTCPSGDECTFRHNEPYIPPVPPLPVDFMTMKPYPNGAQGNGRPTRATPPPPPPRIQNEQALKNIGTNQHHYTNVKKEFFPIAWRVIGGGVRVGSKTSRGDGGSNNANSDSESSDFEYVDSTEPGVPVVPPPLPSIKGAVTLATLKTGTGDAGHRSPTTRKRSNSIPLTPSSSQFIVGNLFSAESPGVL